MREILIIKDFFEKALDLETFFNNRQIKCTLVSINELTQLDIPKSVLIGSCEFEKNINCKNDLLKFSRNIGCSKIIILSSNSQE